jgi:hyperosmotically inducible protein
MRTHLIRKNLVALGMVAALVAAPLAPVAAQDSSAMQSSSMKSNQTVPDKAADAWITTKVKSEFATTKGIKSTDISVTTQDGAVTLSGSVSSNTEKARARKVATKVKGVKSVDASGLTVTAAK